MKCKSNFTITKIVISPHSLSHGRTLDEKKHIEKWFKVLGLKFKVNILHLLQGYGFAILNKLK
jgi:hypothetical protein